MDTSLYCSLLSCTVCSTLSDFFKLCDISWLFSFDIFKVSINFSLSRIVSWLLSAREVRIEDCVRNCSFLMAAISTTSRSLRLSTSGSRFLTASASSYSSSPSNVTVKLITDNLMLTSGKKCGLASLVVRNSLKFASYSTGLSPRFIL